MEAKIDYNKRARETHNMEWSKYQRAIYDAFERDNTSLLIEAVAGSGKTTVLVELAAIMQRAFPEQRAAFVAFNKHVAEELSRRITARNVRAMTLHSVGWAAWRNHGGLNWTPQLDTNKTNRILREVMSWEDNKKWGETTRKLVAIAKGSGLVPSGGRSYSLGLVLGDALVEDSQDAWDFIIEHYDLDAEECNIELVRNVLARSIELAQETCDFDDMLYMPVIAQVDFPKYDVVLLDEAQDVNGIQHEIVSRMVNGTGRVIAVGDRHQAIYGFRGALSDSMDHLAARFKMKEVALSVSYRCPIAVVEHARQWVSQIESAPNAEAGIVIAEGLSREQAEIALEGISKWRGIDDFRPGDVVLCRLTRPLVEAAFTLIRRRIACKVLGRDIGKGLTDLVRKAKIAPGAGMSEALDWLAGYVRREGTRLRAKQERTRAGMLDDRLATVHVFAGEMPDDSTVADLISEIERLFTDNGTSGMVTLATVHKAKGLEWERVFILDAGELMPCPWARESGWELEAEQNIQYVAATRARRELRYIASAELH